MDYRPLGRTSIEVSQICLGSMTWGMQNSESEGHEQIEYALDQGINFIDTAELYAIPPSAQTYGTTETIIGNWFKRSGRRQEVILASKITGPGLDWIRSGRNKIDKQNLEEALVGSLQRLQTDYIDLYQLHWPNRGSYHFQQLWNFNPTFSANEVKDNILEVLQTLARFIQEGRVRAIGLSNETAWGIQQYLTLSEQQQLPRVASIQNEYSLVCRLFEPDLHEIAAAEDCGLLAWSPLSRGALSGKYLNGARPEGSRLTLDPRPDLRSTEQNEKAITEYLALASKHGLDPCQMALAFVNSCPFVTSTIIGATTMEQLKTNIDSSKIVLSDEVFKGIEAIRQGFPVPY